jgi:SAM-dependent methyltransferase
MDNRSYYDTFSETYEAKRHYGYHQFLDDAEFGLIADHCHGKRVLEVGCGTGLILQRAANSASHAVGVDISPGMLEHARQRGLDVHEGTATQLPFEDGHFDLVYSFKVLAHVEGIEDALQEMQRVTRPGGRIFAEFYNRRSLRTLVKRLKPGTKIGSQGGTTDDDVFTRYDSIADIESICPDGLRLEGMHGIRIASPLALPFDLPVLGRAWAGFERALMHTPLKRFGGFLVVEFSRT